MGITIVQKSNLKKAKPNAKKALILAGGAVTGAAFMAGGLKALNDYLVNFGVNDFDMYVGISAGSLLSAPLLAGVPPEEILRTIDGTSKNFTKFSGWHFYWPNMGEYLSRPLSFAKKLLKDKSSPSLYELFPSGLFDSGPIEHYIRKNIEKNRLTNSFKKAKTLQKKDLYVIASLLDGASRVVFGPDEKSDVKISEAIQASCAMPGFYRPVRLGGVDYVDGGVQETSSIDIAIEKGAELIVCYNPFRPHTKAGQISGEGIMAVLNQIFRTFFHTRLKVMIEQYKNDPNFHGDIILIEPKEDDKAFFDLNPLIFSNRIKAACLGFESVTSSINDDYEKIAKILAAYGIKMSKKKIGAEEGGLQSAGDDVEKLRKILES